MLLGFHHVTAIASDPQRNLDFYTSFLGMRLVKHTVNFDDPGTHHFYFGGVEGAPGTLLTFFPWASSLRRAKPDAPIASVALRVDFVDRWKARAKAAGIESQGIEERFGERVLALRDPDGLPLELVEGGSGELHSVTIRDPQVQDLLGLLGFTSTEEDGGRRRFTLGAAHIDVLPETATRFIAPGAVHHIALAVADEAEQENWRRRLIDAGLRVTLPQNRVYFRSIYFRQPHGVLFEMATVAPGFTVDEPLDALGQKLCLPPWLEPVRADIEQKLSPVASLAGITRG